jgi:hypothetical protein
MSGTALTEAEWQLLNVDWTTITDDPESLPKESDRDKHKLGFICHIVEEFGDEDNPQYDDDYCLARFDYVAKRFMSASYNLTVLEWQPIQPYRGEK